MADDPPASASAEPTATPAAATSSPADSQPNTVVVTSIDPVIQLPQLEEIFSAIGQLVSIRWYEPPTGGSGGERVCLLEYEDAGQASSALIISDMHIVLGSREISVRKWDDWWQQQQDELAKKQQQHQQHQAALAAATAAAAAAAIVTTQSSASPISSTSSPPAAVSLSDPSSIASAALAAAQTRPKPLSSQPSTLSLTSTTTSCYLRSEPHHHLRRQPSPSRHRRNPHRLLLPSGSTERSTATGGRQFITESICIC